MPEKTKQTLENRRFLFPRRLTKSDLRDRLVARLKTDYGVGHVDIELADDGTVEYIAIGSRAAGIGPTLPPSTNAVAIRADPAHAASSGDIVQVWSTEPLERVLTGELRGVTDDVVTIAIDAADTSKLDQTTQYKLVTLPVQDRPDREFASLLRAADETMGTITVGAGTELEGTTVSELDVAVMAITRDGSQPEPIPAPDRTLSAGDVIYAIARPEALRRAEAAASRVRAEPTDELTAAETAPATATQPAANTDAGSDVPAPESAAESDDSDTDEPTPDDAEQEISEPSTAEPGVEDSVTEAMESDTAESDAVEADSDEPTEIRTALEKLSESDIESSVGPTIADGDIDGLSESNTDPSESPESDTDGSTGTPPDLEEFVAEPDATDQHDQETQEQSEQETASDSDETVQIWDPEERLEAIESDDTKETDESQN